MKPFRPFLFPKGDNSFENGAPMGATFQPIGNEKKGAKEGKESHPTFGLTKNTRKKLRSDAVARHCHFRQKERLT